MGYKREKAENIIVGHSHPFIIRGPRKEREEHSTRKRGVEGPKGPGQLKGVILTKLELPEKDD